VTKRTIDTVVFDLGGVLIDWDPRHLYRTIFTGPDAEADMELFLAQVCTPEWNAEQDRGRTLAEATAILVERHPEQAELIEAYYGRWDEMLGRPIEGTVRVAAALKRGGLRLVALSNWSAETFPRARHRLSFLDDFDGVLISGALIVVTHWYWLDPLATLIVVAVIIFGTWDLLKDSFQMVLGAVPTGIDPGKVRIFLSGLPGVSRVHDLHIWPLSTTQTALTCHLVMPAGHPGDEFTSRIAERLHAQFNIEHSTLQIELSEDADCRLRDDDVI